MLSQGGFLCAREAALDLLNAVQHSAVEESRSGSPRITRIGSGQKLVAEVTWTGDGLLRHVVYRGRERTGQRVR